MDNNQVLQIIRLVLEIIGGLTIVASAIGGIAVFVFWGLGIYPLLKRLGLGRWCRKILIVSDSENARLFKKDLIDSGVFREKNICEADSHNLADIKEASLILLDYWSMSENDISKVLNNKKKSAGLVVYSPIEKGLVPKDISKKINDEPFTTLVNMRGRLVNDLLLTLMSTSYDKKRR